MIEISSLENFFTDRIIESMFKESAFSPNYQQFLDTVKEYRGLTRWHWKRKRTLEPIIASLSIKIASSMEKYLKENPRTIKFSRKGSISTDKKGK